MAKVVIILYYTSYFFLKMGIKLEILMNLVKKKIKI